MKRAIIVGLGLFIAAGIVVGALAVASSGSNGNSDEATADPTATVAPTEAPATPTSSTTGETPQPSAPTSTPARPVPTPSPGASGPTPLPGANVARAPIERIDLVQRASRSYSVHVVAGLPSGCARPAGSSTAKDANTVRVEVLNSMPSGNVVCTAIYGTYELTVDIGNDFEPGREYLVQVNDKQLTFRAQ